MEDESRKRGERACREIGRAVESKESKEKKGKQEEVKAVIKGRIREGYKEGGIRECSEGNEGRE